MEYNFITTVLTTPGRQFSASKFGPSKAAGVDPPDESDDESGDDGMELFSVPILAVIIWRKITQKNSKEKYYAVKNNSRIAPHRYNSTICDLSHKHMQ